MITELHQHPTKDEAEHWLRALVRDFGLGFHPDTPPADYIADDGARLAEPDIDALTVSLDRLFAVLGDEATYDICFDEAWRILTSGDRQ